jgi:hypothetical protein
MVCGKKNKCACHLAMEFIGWNGRRLAVDPPDSSAQTGNTLIVTKSQLGSHETLWREFLRPDDAMRATINALAVVQASNPVDSPDASNLVNVPESALPLIDVGDPVEPQESALPRIEVGGFTLVEAQGSKLDPIKVSDPVEHQEGALPPIDASESTSSPKHIPAPRICYNDLEKEIAVLRANEIYRIAEVFRGHAKLSAKIKNDAQYNGSLVQRWLATSPPTKQGRAESLVQAVRSFMQDKALEPLRGLVVHVRAGDDYTKMGLGNQAVRTRLQNEIDADLAKHPSTTHLTIVTALHYGVAEQSSMYPAHGLHRYAYRPESHQANLQALKSFIDAQRLPVILRSSASIDEDFCLLCTAERLITSGGGFSKMVGQLQKLRTSSLVLPSKPSVPKTPVNVAKPKARRIPVQRARVYS